MVRASLTLVALGLAASGACSSFGGACSDVGCNDEASFTLRAPENHWDDGAYSLEIRFDDADYQCAFMVPDDLPSTGIDRALDCMPFLDAYLTPERKCETQKNGNSESVTCTPVPDQYYVQASVVGTPRTLNVALQRNGSALLVDTRTLSYSATQPNGPDCGPTCRQASSEFTLE
jgi:hypothetical protein